MKRIRSVVRGVGSYLPERVVTNEDLAALVDTSHEWIVQRTGIEQRHIAADGETTVALGIKAAEARARRCRAGAATISTSSSVATSTPDYTFPSTATDRAGRVSASITAPPSTCRPSAPASSTRVSAADKFLASGVAQARPRHRRRDLLAHPRLEGPHHLRALRRRRRRHRARSAGRRGHARRSRRADVPSALRRAPSRQALRGRRPRFDEDHRRAEDGGPGGLPLRRRHPSPT